jgi:putative aldouronate transport system permease protein
MQTPANYELSNVLDVYVVTMGVENGYYSLATFAGLFQGLINLAIVIVANAILRKKADIALW